jgi:hypothetical protein
MKNAGTWNFELKMLLRAAACGIVRNFPPKNTVKNHKTVTDFRNKILLEYFFGFILAEIIFPHRFYRGFGF